MSTVTAPHCPTTVCLAWPIHIGL